MKHAHTRAVASRAPNPVLCLLAVAATLALPTTASAHAASSIGATTATAPVAGWPTTVDNAARAPRVEGRVSDRNSIGGDGVRVRGLVTHAGARHVRVYLQVREAGHSNWRGAASTLVTDGRKFTIVWHGGRPGRYLTRLTVRRQGQRFSAHLGAAFVFRRTVASWYGPGFYGHRTACGGTLTASVLGVANKTLPCGTRVTFHFRGRTVTARVIDRGPYVAGREWDLTPALKRRLHFGSTGVVDTTS